MSTASFTALLRRDRRHAERPVWMERPSVTAQGLKFRSSS